jgi:hypothetical protein
VDTASEGERAARLPVQLVIVPDRTAHAQLSPWTGTPWSGHLLAAAARVVRYKTSDSGDGT